MERGNQHENKENGIYGLSRLISALANLAEGFQGETFSLKEMRWQFGMRDDEFTALCAMSIIEKQ